MRFKIISVGWNCADYLLSTLLSIDNQTLSNYDVMVVDDASTDSRQVPMIKEWCDARDERWSYTINDAQMHVVYNQVHAIEALAPEDEDVIVWLDLDGDQFAHPHVLERLQEAYSDPNILMTYGNYKPYPTPPSGVMVPICDPFPEHVVQQHAYRQEILSGYCHFNHLRTMKARVYKSIPKEYFFFQGTSNWYQGGTDYAFMVPALELAGGRYKCFEEVLCLYNHGNPLADNKNHPNYSTMANVDSLSRPALAPLVDGEIRYSEYPATNRKDLFLPAEERRHLLRLAASLYGLRNFVETGTANGDTCDFLHNDFTMLYTIELEPALFQQSRERLAVYKNVEVLEGNSARLLPQVLSQLNGPALIWLDGHYCGPGSARDGKDTPVVEELAAIFASSQRHVVYIDDARIFDEGPEHHLEPGFVDYPALSWVRWQAQEHGYQYLLKDDIMRLVPEGMPISDMMAHG